VLQILSVALLIMNLMACIWNVVSLTKSKIKLLLTDYKFFHICEKIRADSKGECIMGESIVITSGKGGVGKTTTTANIGTALALMDKKVCLIDTDIGLRNLDVIMGLENRIIYDIVDVIEERCKLKQALIKDKRFDDLALLPAAQ